MKKLSMDELNRKSVEEFKNSQKRPVVLFLDNIRSLHNVGSVFRSGDAFSVQKIILSGITGTPPNREINKTALGATESVEWEYCENALDGIRKLKQEGWKIVSLEQADKSIPLDIFFPLSDAKYCFVFGNEVFGVNQEIVSESDMVVEIPQFGTKHSLNISVTVGIVLWDYHLKVQKGGIAS